MVQSLSQKTLVTFEEFAQWKPENGKYELHDGVIVEMPQPTGDHENVVGFLTLEISVDIKQLGLPYFIPKTALIKPPDNESGYSPDIMVVNRSNLIHEPLWKKQSTVTQGASIPLVIEVVSTNWRDDYFTKLGQAVGIPEYWIVDYAALGGRRFLGSPKQPTISIYSLVEGEYQIIQFRGDDQIVSPTFPRFSLTANQIFPPY
ncbi:MAG: Uma2 family endonuclease [Cylindrospermopsis raciborskii KL1]|jgi:Uma2 family endonuclease|uniref:Uma2 family endonuclease n=1 Tax=Cylindrospermopsis raciborskii TaxID=77022 RepID=UPI001A20CCA8|nr:Uma2 family endonuclease [Cylindrospermopsis raciborskii]MBG0744539.1 Uma2 family endonuclease [Cylindrospermopsis raciborskii KL1]